VLAECTGVVPLGGSGGAVRLALARVDGLSAVVIGQDRHAATRGARLDPAAFRLARRGMQLAAELRLPLVTLIDTPGADMSARSENDGLAREIARCIAAMVSLTVPSTSVLVGQGTGGGALALFPAARAIALPDAWLAPLPPEGASVIAFGDVAHAPAMAEIQGIGAPALLRDGLLAAIVPQRPTDTTQDLSRAVLAEARAQLTAQFPSEKRLPM
jgi:acyl-CoA carboxylase subunit beta